MAPNKTRESQLGAEIFPMTIMEGPEETRYWIQGCWSAYIFFNQIHYFMVKITTIFNFP
jgi:hypothetical protein